MIRRFAEKLGYRRVCGKFVRFDRHRTYGPCPCSYHRRKREEQEKKP